MTSGWIEVKSSRIRPIGTRLVILVAGVMSLNTSEHGPISVSCINWVYAGTDDLRFLHFFLEGCFQ